MTVLVAYASRHGATAGIADRIATRMGELGLESEAKSVTDLHQVDGYDAYVVGSAAYMGHWMKEATAFVKRHRALLAERPVWLFSSGPVGTDLVDKEGRDILESSRPKEFDDLQTKLHPRGERVFFGAWDPDAPAKNMAERLFKKMPVSRDVLPVGDFRDWPAIDAWAEEIAAALAGDYAAAQRK